MPKCIFLYYMVHDTISFEGNGIKTLPQSFHDDGIIPSTSKYSEDPNSKKGLWDISYGFLINQKGIYL